MIDIIVVAAGQGARMGAGKNKLFLELDNVPILYMTLQRLQKIPEVARIYPVMKKEEMPLLGEILTVHGQLDKVQAPIEGGKERADSVRNGLHSLSQIEGSEVIMVHDGARPFFSQRMIQELQAGAMATGCAIPVMPVVETTRQVKGAETQVINRDELRLVQTPQAFLRKDIYDVFLEEKQAVLNLTDEASFFERKKKILTLVAGEKYNIKMTQPQDIDWAKALIIAFKELQG